MNIAVLMGGISPERNVSMAGGRSVISALQKLGHTAYPVDPARGADGILNGEDIEIGQLPPTDEELKQFSTRKIIECINSEIFDNIDLAFIVLHGQNGEDGKIQSLLELRGIPYTGSGIKSSSMAIDKITSKLLFTAAGLPTPEWAVVRPGQSDDYDFIENLRSELGSAMVIKPNDQGSTIGLSIVEDGNLDDIKSGIEKAFKYSDLVLVEKYIYGSEITVGMVADEILPVIEIIPESGFYDYEHKYTKGKTVYECPAELEDSHAEFIQDLAYNAFHVLGCTGFARADFRMDEEGQIFCLEVNTIPGFTETSLVPMAASVSGLEFPELCQKIINVALGIGEDEDAEQQL